MFQQHDAFRTRYTAIDFVLQATFFRRLDAFTLFDPLIHSYINGLGAVHLYADDDAYTAH